VIHRVVRTTALAALLVPLPAALTAQNPPPTQAQAGVQAQAPLPPLPPNGWRIDRAHSGVTFRVRHLGISWVNGVFNDWTAELVYDPAHPENASVTARIQVTSISTSNERRDNDLRSGRFFAADSFPELSFTSRSVQRAGEGRLRITGDLTMHGVTRPVTLDVEASAVQSGQRGRRVAFTATVTVDRKEWGMTFSPLAEGIRTAGDEVRITIDLEAVQPVAPAGS